MIVIPQLNAYAMYPLLAMEGKEEWLESKIE